MNKASINPMLTLDFVAKGSMSKQAPKRISPMAANATTWPGSRRNPIKREIRSFPNPAFMALPRRGEIWIFGSGWAPYDYGSMIPKDGLEERRTGYGEQTLSVQISREVRPVVGSRTIKKNSSMFMKEWELLFLRSCCLARASL